MGTTFTCVSKQGMDGLCTSRGFPQFVPPNTDHVTYEYDFSAPQGEITLHNGNEGLLSPLGFVLRSSESVRGAPRWKMVKECLFRPAESRLNLSGRFFVNVPEMPRYEFDEDMASPRRGTCVFKVCTRGRPVFESVRTRTYTHTAHTVTSGVFYALFVDNLPDGLYLCPRLLLLLKSGDEVPLVEDKLGPLRAPLAFYVDFSILDDGGRNTQMDVIFRVLPSAVGSSSGALDKSGAPPILSPPGGLRTLRTCLQDYTTYNSEVPVPHIAMGDSELRTLVQSGAVYLQNLVLSEVALPGVTPTAGPSAAASPISAMGSPAAGTAQRAPGEAPGPALADAAGGGGAGGGVDGEAASMVPSYTTPSSVVLDSSAEAAQVLFEGPIARVAVGAPSAAATNSVASTAAPAVVQQMSGADAAGGMALQAPAASSRSSMRPQGSGYSSARALSAFTGNMDDETDNFWYHVRYKTDSSPHARRAHPVECDFQAPLKGEFWLTKEAVAKKNVYFHCSSTLAQATTMCIIFRFSCPTDYLSLIENQASELLKDLHIPTNGVVLGVEEDPRHRGLYRIFVEHRNEILDDMVVCEGLPQDLSTIAAHQEVYDSGDYISYRLTLLHPDGSRQEASLQLATEKLEVDDNLAEEPSLRFPISPCVSRQLLSPANRIFVYTSVAAAGPEDAAATGSFSREDDVFKTPAATGRLPGGDMMMGGTQSDCTAEEWQSVGGGASDGEEGACPQKGVALGVRGSSRSASPRGDHVEDMCMWQRPVVDSMLLVTCLEEAPFKCSSSG